ncbi:sensor domain-containing diguanylate cyclase [Vibrio sp. YIC-376]|uniref:sensor domain-containing diguanylate cyclase n=1 Tax=Vibrio sp. YIC-376 TaxID=3136162 RepID=UPI00402A7C11
MRDKLNLRKLILILCVFSVMSTLLNMFYSIYRVQHELIVSNTIESNRVYAEKMAEMTDLFIETAMSQLEYSAHKLSNSMENADVLQQEVERLRTQTEWFNSVVIVNQNGVIISVSPETLQVKGVKLTSERSLQSLSAKKPLITDPFVSPAGNYITSISYPIFSEHGEYLGYIAGTIYLDQHNVLSSILGRHGYKDGSYLYVVDRQRTLIYHPNKERVGQVIVNNEAIQAVENGVNGGKAIVNSLGVEMLAGYAPVANSGWGIVAQRSEYLTLSVLNEQMWNVVWESLPMGALTLLVIWISSVFISKPLWQLASVVKNFESHTSTVNDLIEVKPWYYEASHLKRSFLSAFNIVSNTIDQLHLDTLTDSMTGLLNRRGLDRAIDNLRIQNIPFSVLALDVDYFKKVNDTFGHEAGDLLLKNVANLIKEQARKDDVVCRAGGEEFMVFLANADVRQAIEVAERIRKSIENYEFDTVGRITISVGVGHWVGNDEPINAVLKSADDALYQAKHKGRNRTELNDTDSYSNRNTA